MIRKAIPAILRLLQPRPLLNPDRKNQNNAAGRVYFTSDSSNAVAPKPDQSEMPISFKLAEAGAGLQ
jgi:hypothetical protein